MTSAGPLKVLDLSCRRILTSSNGVTITDSVAPAAAPVKMASIWVLGLCPLSVKYAPHHPAHQLNPYTSLQVVVPFAPTDDQLRSPCVSLARTHT
jgi:hypothetical protein